MPAESIQQRLQRALELQLNGQMSAAEPIYRAVLAEEPFNADALHLLGVLCSDTARAEEAVRLLTLVAQLAPMSPSVQLNLGLAHRARGDVETAMVAWQRAAQLDSNFAEPHANMAAEHRARGNAVDAEASWRRAASIAPGWTEASLRLAELLIERGAAEEAETLLRSARDTDPNSAALATSLAFLLAGQRRYIEALPLFESAAAAEPNEVRAQVNLGQAMWLSGRPVEARNAFDRAIRIDSTFAPAHHGLAVALKTLVRPAEAAIAEHRAIELDPNWADAQHGLGNILHELGCVEQAIAAYRRCIELKSTHSAAHSSLLVVLNYTSGHDARYMFDEHRRWAATHADPLTPARIRRATDRRDPGRRLRIAYVSPDLCRHAVAHFFEPLLAAHDRDRFHVTCYASVVREDEVSARLKSSCDRWLNVANLDDEALARVIEADQIDIAIDLAGHTADNRLLALARRPAPIQISYLGYPNTTGMRAIDYVLTDEDLDPSGTEAFHSERLIRLKRTMHCYAPPSNAPPVQECAADAPLRFGSFNRLEKISPITVELWAAVLKAVAGSTLALKASAFDDAAARSAILKRFGLQGVASDRIELLARDATPEEHYARYAMLDVALDTYPYNGTTTTCESLWMGVPVITLEGPTRVARTTAGILRAVGLTDCIARNPAEFIAAAKRCATDRRSAASLRSTMRDRMRQSPLMDGASLAAAIEHEYRRVWHEWCARAD